jgi:alpha-glucoside transport system substrate-binding protein
MIAARGRIATVLAVLVASVLTPVACGTATGSDGVVILAPWTGPEEAQFRQVLDRAHIKYSYQGTRALEQVLQADVRNGNPPDIAVLPSPGDVQSYVDSHELQPVDPVSSAGSYDPQWRALTAIKRRDYAVVVKADLKSVFWYDPSRLDRYLPGGRPPTTWAQLVALRGRITSAGGNPWCLGMAADATSGWPGTDWIEDIVLHEFGAVVYEQWAKGRLPWSSDQIRKAWQQWGALLGGAGTPALFTDFGDAGRLMFAERPGCYLDHEASFIITSYVGYPARPKPVTGFDFFPFPAMDTAGDQPMEVSADLAVMFHGSPDARRLMTFLASDAGQRIWPGITGSGAFSVDRGARPGTGANDVTQRISGLLTADTGNQLCFDASDMMPSDMSTAFNRAVLEYLADPGQLDTLLTQLDDVRKQAYANRNINSVCGHTSSS